MRRAARCSAPATLETRGELRARVWRLDNYLKSGAAVEFWDQRLRLNLTWPVAERVRVQVRADILEGMWGESDQAPAVGQAAGAAKPAATALGTGVKQEIVFDWVNLQFVWPGTPLRLSVGRQDVSWGTGFWVQEDNRDRFEVAAKLDPVVIVVAYDTFVEVLSQTTASRDDQQGWAVGAVTDAAGFRFGLLVAYFKDGSRTRFPAGDAHLPGGRRVRQGHARPGEAPGRGLLRRRHARPRRPRRPRPRGLGGLRRPVPAARSAG